MKSILKIFIGVVTLVSFVSCDKDDDDYTPPAPENNNITIFRAAGDSLGIVGTMNSFRAVAGDPVNTAPGATGGRREINWDGVADNSPADFFNPTDVNAPAGRKRGLVYFPSTVLLRTATDAFASIEPSYANQFLPFSKQRLFNSDNSNITEIRFKVAGTNTDASVKTFGVVFADVDDPNATTVEVFDGNKSLGIAKAQPFNGKFSFVGIKAVQGKITRVKIVTGNAILAKGVKDLSDNGDKDLVVMDDLIYDEPVAN